MSDFLSRTLGLPEAVLPWVYPLAAVLGIAVVSYSCTAVFRLAVMPAVQRLTAKTKATWDDRLFNRRVMRAFRRIIPPVVWYALLPLAFSRTHEALPVMLKVCSVYLVVVSLVFVSVLLNSLYEISEGHQKLRNRPLKGVYQMTTLLVIVVGCFLIILPSVHPVIR